MYWKRELSELFTRAAASFPAVLITGPRQSGKTTFLKHQLGSDADYVTFDDPLERQFAREDPAGFLDRFTAKPVILDEIQYVPEIFSYLKIRIDNDRDNNGRWIMTGSQQFQLMKNISDSLAGRVAILELMPFNHTEIRSPHKDSIEQNIWLGGYPPVAVNPQARDLWLSAYLQTYIERDVRQLQGIRNLNLFETFISLCAADHGQLLNKARLAGNCGISQPALKEWLSVLEASYILYFLRPYYENFGKRITKSSKLYFLDTAIPAFLTRQPSAESLWSGAMGGAFFEGWVICETVKMFAARGLRQGLYFWRSHDGVEVDLLIESGGKLHSVEIKQTGTPNLKHTDPLRRFRDIIPEEKAGKQIIVCTVQEEKPLPHNIQALPWKLYSRWLDGILQA